MQTFFHIHSRSNFFKQFTAKINHSLKTNTHLQSPTSIPQQSTHNKDHSQQEKNIFLRRESHLNVCPVTIGNSPTAVITVIIFYSLAPPSQGRALKRGILVKRTIIVFASEPSSGSIP